MTELMKELQQWANRGAFKFPSGDDKGGFTMRKEDSNNPDIGAWELTPEQTFSIQCVLDGTIQVWRPVEHYKPSKGSDVIAIVDGIILQGSIDDMGLFDDDARYCGVPFTHWQPLPQPSQKGK